MGNAESPGIMRLGEMQANLGVYRMRVSSLASLQFLDTDTGDGTSGGLSGEQLSVLGTMSIDVVGHVRIYMDVINYGSVYHHGSLGTGVANTAEFMNFTPAGPSVINHGYWELTNRVTEKMTSEWENRGTLVVENPGAASEEFALLTDGLGGDPVILINYGTLWLKGGTFRVVNTHAPVGGEVVLKNGSQMLVEVITNPANPHSGYLVCSGTVTIEANVGLITHDDATYYGPPNPMQGFHFINANVIAGTFSWYTPMGWAWTLQVAAGGFYNLLP
jgi:hypothetical protein